MLRCAGTAEPPRRESQDTLSADIQHHTLTHYAGGEEMTTVAMIKENGRGASQRDGQGGTHSAAAAAVAPMHSYTVYV